MSRRRSFALFDAPRTAAEMTTLMMMSPFVIGARMTQFWMNAASPSAGDHHEATRMVSEKMAAAGESVAAMNAAAIEAATTMAMTAATGGRSTVNHGDAILSAGLKPYTKRVRANRKRLSR